MRSKVRFPAAAALAIAVVALAGSPVAQAKANKRNGATDTCKYAACGSEFDKEFNGNAKGAGGSGGGKPQNDCSKVFAKWGDGSVTVYVSNDGAPAGLATALSDFTDNCFSTWACDSGLTFSISTNPNSAASADITVTWDDLGSSGVLGQTTTWYGAGLISASDIEMNSDGSIDWTLGPNQNVDAEGCFTETANGSPSSSNYDLLAVLLHEVGHALGISHPTNRCSTRDACYLQTMNPCTDAEEFMRRTLESGDIKSIQTNYGQ